jgi:hypothetical protein
VLLDECVDRRLAGDIVGHDVTTVPDAGWAAFKNGELLTRAQQEFDVLVTVDRNLPFQQGLLRFSPHHRCCGLDRIVFLTCGH